MSRRRLGEFESYVRTRAGRGRRRGRTRASPNTSVMSRPNSGLSAPEQPPPLRAPEVSRAAAEVPAAGDAADDDPRCRLRVRRRACGDAPVRGPGAGPDRSRDWWQAVWWALLVTVWVVGIRGLLHDRAVLDRWVTDVAATLRSTVEERVATRVLAAETALTSDLAARDEAEGATAADRVAEIDAELREHAVATAGPRGAGPPGAAAAAGARRCARRVVRLQVCRSEDQLGSGVVADGRTE